jgi:transposase-like protein
VLTARRRYTAAFRRELVGRCLQPGASVSVIAPEITALADVIAVDTNKHLITLKGPRGNLVDLNVQDPEQLKNIKKGDQVEVVYAEAVAVAVAPAAKPAAK